MKVIALCRVSCRFCAVFLACIPRSDPEVVPRFMNKRTCGIFLFIFTDGGAFLVCFAPSALFFLQLCLRFLFVIPVSSHLVFFSFKLCYSLFLCSLFLVLRIRIVFVFFFVRLPVILFVGIYWWCCLLFTFRSGLLTGGSLSVNNSEYQ
jgi:hypothetical protein